MPDLIKMLRADGRFTALNQALADAGMVDTLSGSGPFTLFAATDEAFGRAPDGWAEPLRSQANPDILILTRVLTRHVVAEKLPRTALVNGLTLPSLAGEPLRITLTDDQPFVEGVPIAATLEASNGLIYVIGSVLPDGRRQP